MHAGTGSGGRCRFFLGDAAYAVRADCRGLVERPEGLFRLAIAGSEVTRGAMRGARRTVLRSFVAGILLAPWLRIPGAAYAAGSGASVEASGPAGPAGLTDEEIVLGMSAAFSGPSRGLGIELYRGAAAYFNHVNRIGGVGGRKVTLRTYDDGYQPDPSVENTMTLMLRDNVFALFGYVGTPTVTRVLPMLKKFQKKADLPLLSVHRSAAPARTSLR